MFLCAAQLALAPITPPISYCKPRLLIVCHACRPREPGCYDHSGREGCHEISMKHLSACQNFTFTAENCQCEPREHDTCDKCADAQHLGCVWANVTTNLTFSVDGVKATLPLYSRSSCRVGNPITGPGTTVRNATWKVLGIPFYAALVSEPTSFFWGQCTLPGSMPFGLGLCAGLFAICILWTLCRRLRAWRRRSRSSMLLQEAGSVQIDRR